MGLNRSILTYDNTRCYSFGAVSYSSSIVTMALSCIVCEMYRLIGRASRNFYTPAVFSAPAGVIALEFREDV